jgi:monoamine oxidase
MQKADKEITQGFPQSEGLKVAIIGAGVSGLYSAYRLTDSSEGLDASQVQIFEMSHRIGGRLESVVLPGMEISGELGGMRYINTQEIVTTLIESVFSDELTHVDFPMGKDSHHFGYFRKQRMKMDAWEDAQKKGEAFSVRYFLNDEDKGFSADQLFNKIVYEVLSNDPHFMDKYSSKIANPSKYEYTFELTREDWNDIKPFITYNFEGPYNGKKVNSIGFWNLIKDRLSEEGYNFLANAGGYYSNTINWNAAEAFPYMVGDFSDQTVQYKTIEGGYDKIAYALADIYLKKQGAVIWGGNRLVSFTRKEEGSYRYELLFFNEDQKKEHRIQANKIILAIPARALELLDQNNFFFNQDTNKKLQKNMNSVIKEPSFKILMGFEYPWWKEDFGTEAGHSITDLPMRQCYYFGTDSDNSHSLFLGSYNDMRTSTFWNVLEDADIYEPKVTKLLNAEALADYKSVQASKVMVDEVMKQVKELHGKEDIPMPYVTWYKNWTEDPYGGGYHAWKAGYDISETMKYMRKPNLQEAIFICGEAYSDQQGWVEGAFCVAENMLQEHFNLKRPKWLNESYYLGW